MTAGAGNEPRVLSSRKAWQRLCTWKSRRSPECRRTRSPASPPEAGRGSARSAVGDGRPQGARQGGDRIEVHPFERHRMTEAACSGSCSRSWNRIGRRHTHAHARKPPDTQPFRHHRRGVLASSRGPQRRCVAIGRPGKVQADSLHRVAVIGRTVASARAGCSRVEREQRRAHRDPSCFRERLGGDRLE